MASITSLTSSSSSSSIYSSSNAITGLASGLDTEALIESAVQGYEEKITSLQQDLTKVEWEQEAYRDIIDDLVDFNSSYADSTSKTNLLSASFFNSAIKVTATGANASKVSVSGDTDSSIYINSITQLATAATYSVPGSNLTVGDVGGNTISGGWTDLTEKTSRVAGTLSFQLGDSSYEITLAADEIYSSGEEMAAAVNEKLEAAGADTSKIYASYEDGVLTLHGGSENEPLTVNASGTIASTLKIGKDGDGNPSATISGNLSMSVAEQLAGQKMTFTLDGETKTITLDNLSDYADENGDLDGGDVLRALQEKVDEAFGTNIFGESKIKVKQSSGGDSDWSGTSFQIDLTVAEGSSLSVSGGEALGLNSSASSHVNTGGSLRSILGDDMGGLTADDNGSYELTINGTTLKFSADDTLSSVLSAINESDADVSVTYSKLTNSFTFTATETGANNTIDMNDGALGSALFGGGTLTAGQDAVFSVTANGDEMLLTRSSNKVDMDGLTVTLKGIFEGGEAIGFSVETDSDKIINAVSNMIEDYNAMLSKIKSAYSTMPLEDSSGDEYEPLTDDDKADMSETAIANYEEKAKTGLLFGDRDLSNLYNGLVTAISKLSVAGIGIDSTYSDGTTTLTLDEDKLRSVLESDPERVQEAFAGTGEEDGFMDQVDTYLERYAKTYGANKGILIEKAGSSHAATSLLDNELLSKMNDIEEQIEKWQDKLEDRIDYYTNKFTQLEVLISEMNSQSSTLSSLSSSY